MSFEWIDPFEQKTRAEGAERRAASAYSEGQRAVSRTLDRAASKGFSEKLNTAVDQTARMVAQQMLQSVGAKWSYQFFQERVMPDVAEAFRQGCKEVVAAIVDRAEVRTHLESRDYSMEETLTVTVETIAPIRVHARFVL